MLIYLFKVTFQSYFLAEDHAASFRKNLETWLGENNDEESRIENPTQKFLKALDAYLVCKENIQHALTTTLVN